MTYKSARQTSFLRRKQRTRIYAARQIVGTIRSMNMKPDTEIEPLGSATTVSQGEVTVRSSYGNTRVMKKKNLPALLIARQRGQ